MKIFVNYFNPKGTIVLRRMAQMALGCFQENSTAECEIWILDGSGVEDRELRTTCLAAGIHYQCSSTVESFAQTYNRAFALAAGGDFCISASDVFVPKGWDAFRLQVKDSRFEGMIVPYISASDYPTQEVRSERLRPTLIPISCTINLNYFTSKAGAALVGLDPSFSGSYNDIDLLVRLRRGGLEVLLHDMGPVKHLGRMTVVTASSWAPKDDRLRFARLYPELYASKWWYKPYKHVFCRSWLLRTLLFVAFWTVPGNILRRILVMELVLGTRFRWNRGSTS